MANKKIPVVVSPNMKKETIFLNSSGDRIDNLKNRQVIGKAFEEEPTPPPTQEPQSEPESKPNPLATMIEQKVQEAVAKSISNIDIGKMVEDAITKSFGGK